MVGQQDTGVPPASETKSKSGSTGKMIAAVVVVIILIVAAVALFTLPAHKKGVAVSSSVSGPTFAVTGQEVTFMANISGAKSITFYYGDGSVSSTTATSASMRTYDFNHTYSSPGSAFIYYTVNTSSSTISNSASLLPVTVSPSSTFVGNESSLGTLSYNVTSSTPTLVSGEAVFAPGAHVEFSSGYYTEPAIASYQIVSQYVQLMNGSGSMIDNISVNYTWNATLAKYLPVASSQIFTISFPSQGLFILQQTTVTALITNRSTGTYASAQRTSDFMDVAIFTGGNVVTSSAKTILINDELEQGGYRTLDPAIAFDTISLEPIYNTILPLVAFNGSSTSTFVPALATSLPSVSNGGINSNYANYTASYVNQNGATVTYQVHLQPYENYTFQIRSSALWQDGTHVTAWDILYSFARILLFDAGSPLTSGWMIGPYLLPGLYFRSNTFFNITQNITVDNATNSITFHFQHPMTPVSVFGLLAFYRYTSANWLIAHGAGIGWNYNGFLSYEKYGSQTDYNTYVQTHAFSDGPYEVSYAVPGTEIVLVKNPTFVSPGSWLPAASIDRIVIEYISQPSTIYLNLKSGEAQSGILPTNQWTGVETLSSSHIDTAYLYPTPDVYFYKFNANINTTELSSIVPSANLPYNMFTSENARRAFAYSYNYPLFLSRQVGNSIFNTTFATQYAGFLESGVVFQQNYSAISQVAQVPVFNLTIAKQYWNAFMSSEAARVGISLSGGSTVYNGKPLNIPIFIQTADPVDLLGAQTWGQELQKVIPGLQFEVVTLPFTEIIAYSAIRGQNPLPLFWWSLAPAYAYPTDSVGGSEMPTNISHLGGESITPYWFNSSANSLANATQTAQLNDLLSWYDAATSTANTAIAEMYFHMINEMFVNLTLCVYTEQIYNYHIVSNSISSQSIIQYQENGLLGNDMLYNYITYT